LSWDNVHVVVPQALRICHAKVLFTEAGQELLVHDCSGMVYYGCQLIAIISSHVSFLLYH